MELLHKFSLLPLYLFLVQLAHQGSCAHLEYSDHESRIVISVFSLIPIRDGYCGFFKFSLKVKTALAVAQKLSRPAVDVS